MGFLNGLVFRVWRSGYHPPRFNLKVGTSYPRSYSSGVQEMDRVDRVRLSVKAKPEEVVIAMGSNVGDRVNNLNRALKLMRGSGIAIQRHSCLYETVPMHYVNQPLFLNSAVSAVTSLDPHELLRVLKDIERQLGRSQDGVRYGPRPIDLDVIFYGVSRCSSEELQIPHPMFSSRPFVLAPLVDILGSTSGLGSQHWSQAGNVLKHWNDIGGEACIEREGMRRVLPINGKLLDWRERTHVMGVLNVTPDSFSDGGKYLAVDKAARHVNEMISQGATFIDVGAQSTRPNARRLSTEEELERLVPVLEEVVKIRNERGGDVFISVDTFDAEVARVALGMGADIINDVSAGRLDPNMLSTLAELEAPCILMHMRGEPSTMTNKTNTTYSGSLAGEVADELGERIEVAEKAGVAAWNVLADPGFGFAKNGEQNVELLAELKSFRNRLGRSVPVVAGISRKRFLGGLCGYEKAEDRDMATVAAATAAILNGANIVRAHNVKAVRDAAIVADALRKYS